MREGKRCPKPAAARAGRAPRAQLPPERPPGPPRAPGARAHAANTAGGERSVRPARSTGERAPEGGCRTFGVSVPAFYAESLKIY